jgi:hypothetical protein
MKLLCPFTMTILIFCSVALSQSDKDIPRFVDMSLNGIHFCDSTSAKTMLGEDFNMVMKNDRAEDGTYFEGEAMLSNASQTELLTIYGSSKYFYARFTISVIKGAPKKATILSKVPFFVSAKHIHLGMSRKEVTAILGNSFRISKEGQTTIYRYEVDDNEELMSICELPEYSAEYKFKKEKLVEFSFGFGM